MQNGRLFRACWTVASLTGLLACETGTSVPGPALQLVLTISSASFMAVEGGQVSHQAFVVSSGGSEPLRWSAVSDAPWLTLTPASGTTPTPVVVSASPQGLAAGTYPGKVTMAADGASNSPQTIQV